MGWFSNRGVAKNAVDTGVHTIKLRKVGGGHSPDRHRIKPWRGTCPPIDVEQSGRGYRLVDGTARVAAARAAGARTIRARVWTKP